MIDRLIKLYQILLSFFMKGLWEPAAGISGQIFRAIAGRMYLTTKVFLREKMQYRAAALTYTTLLSIVPILAIIFATAKGFGLTAAIEQTLRKNISASAEFVDTLVGLVNSYLNHTRGGAFIGFGLILLLWTLLKLTDAIESSFNQIWQVKHQRSMFRKITDYTAVFFLLPIFILVSGGLSVYIYSIVGSLLSDGTALRPAVLTMVRIIPFGFTCLFFTGLFAFMPNTRVKIRSALVAGIPTGIAFQLLQFFYIHSQIQLSAYDAIYGSFAALPLFMLMCQFSWYIILAGASLSYVDQNYHTFYYGKEYVKTSREFHDYLCLTITRDICQRFMRGERPVTAEVLALSYREPLRLIVDTLYELCNIGILVEVAGDEKEEGTAYLPAIDVALLTNAYVMQAIDAEGDKTMPEINREQWEEYCARRKKSLQQL